MTIIVVELFASALAAENPPAEQIWVSRSGQFRMTYESEVDPIIINRIHSWVLHVETADGHPVSGAEITIQGGMPEHDHGLPTRPRITRSLDDGAYLIEGMRFHMNGHWELDFTISTGSDEDTVVIPLEL